MGKLAARLADAQRSGVYRIESTEALEEAARANGFAVARFDLADAAALPARFDCADGQVLLFTGAPGSLDELLGELEAAAARCREQGLRFFAAFLDPEGLLPLPPLYNWRRR